MTAGGAATRGRPPAALGARSAARQAKAGVGPRSATRPPPRPCLPAPPPVSAPAPCRPGARSQAPSRRRHPQTEPARERWSPRCGLGVLVPALSSPGQARAWWAGGPAPAAAAPTPPLFAHEGLSELSLSSERKSLFIFSAPFLTFPLLSRKKKKKSAGGELIFNRGKKGNMKSRTF